MLSQPLALGHLLVQPLISWRLFVHLLGLRGLKEKKCWCYVFKQVLVSDRVAVESETFGKEDGMSWRMQSETRLSCDKLFTCTGELSGLEPHLYVGPSGILRDSQLDLHPSRHCSTWHQHAHMWQTHCCSAVWPIHFVAGNLPLVFSVV